MPCSVSVCHYHLCKVPGQTVKNADSWAVILTLPLQDSTRKAAVRQDFSNCSSWTSAWRVAGGMWPQCRFLDPCSKLQTGNHLFVWGLFGAIGRLENNLGIYFETFPILLPWDILLVYHFLFISLGDLQSLLPSSLWTNCTPGLWSSYRWDCLHCNTSVFDQFWHGVLLAFENEFRSVPSSSSFWKSLRIGIKIFKCLVKFMSEALSSWTFVFWEVFVYWFNLVAVL